MSFFLKNYECWKVSLVTQWINKYFPKYELQAVKSEELQKFALKHNILKDKKF